jgi:beta-lactam-binding protein with PASTA domain
VRRLLLALVVVALIAGGFGGGYYVGTHADDSRVPDLLGLGTENGGQAAARHELAGPGLRIGKVGWMVCTPDEKGLVVQQSPPAGTVVPKGTTANIAIGDDGTHLIGLFPRGSVKSCLPGTQQPARSAFMYVREK